MIFLGLRLVVLCVNSQSSGIRITAGLSTVWLHLLSESFSNKLKDDVITCFQSMKERVVKLY
jgi:hypothetical protein